MRVKNKIPMIAAELVNFGALLGFMAVNLCVWRLYFCKLGQRQANRILVNLVLPIVAFGVCLYIWVNLSRFALSLGALWMGIGVLYLVVLTRGFRKQLADLRL
jgi:ABC-type spermidine/putrescine transport system permease subunit II